MGGEDIGTGERSLRLDVSPNCLQKSGVILQKGLQHPVSLLPAFPFVLML